MRMRGDGVSGMRPPAVLEENIPACDFIGVHTAVAIVADGYQMNVRVIGAE
jgi:hypothetical protein